MASPGFLPRSTARRSSKLSTAAPPRRTITSPSLSPAVAAPLPGTTPPMRSPSRAPACVMTTPRNAPPTGGPCAGRCPGGATRAYAGRAPPARRSIAAAAIRAISASASAANEGRVGRAGGAARRGERAGEADGHRRARGVVVGARMDDTVHAPEMVVGRAEHDRLVGERGLGAGEDADHVRPAPHGGREVHPEAHAIAGLERPGGLARERPGDQPDPAGRRVERRQQAVYQTVPDRAVDARLPDIYHP